ncbi:MAG: glycosyltransferase family 2 protein [candidate division WOR-3 bacterium]
MKLSIIIVNYNSKSHILSCLKSLSDIGQVKDYEVFVVDNSSTDDSVSAIEKLYPWVKLIKNNRNLGFAKANNQAIKLAQGEYILLLNPDTVVVNDAINKTINFMDRNLDISAVSCRVELANGKLDPACHRGFPTPWASLCYFLGLEKLFPKSRLFGQYHMTYKLFSVPHEIDVPSGCFFLIRRSTVEKIGLLDEDYFLFGEDVDWAYRIKQAGGKIYFYPDAKIIHYKGTSSGIKKETHNLTQASIETRKKSVNYFYDAMKIFYDKYYKKKYPFFITWLVYAGIEIKRSLSLRKLKV